MSEHQSTGAMVVTTIKSDAFQSSIAQALPPGITKDKFTRAAITAIQKNPSIVEGERNSLYSALVESAQVGLLCDGKQAALVIFNTKHGNGWIKKVQFMPMVGGIILNLGRIGVTVDSQVVYENDEFSLQFGDDPRITHIPAKLGTDRGAMIGAYAICRTKDGGVYREVMDRAQIEAVRNQSRAKDSLMWTQFASEGWRKTVLRRCAKRIPIVDDVVAKTLDADDQTFQFDEAGSPTEGPAQGPETVVSTQEPDRQPEESENPAPRETSPSPQASQSKPTPASNRRPTGLSQALEADEMF